MSRRRRRARHYLDAGDGVTIAVSHRGPIDQETADALTALARAVAEQMPPERELAGADELDVDE